MRRTKKVVHQFQQDVHITSPFVINREKIPKKIAIPKFGRDLVIPINLPEYKSKLYFTSQKGTCHPFVEIVPEYISWLQKFSDSILLSKTSSAYPLFNGKLDFTNPAISGFRLYLSRYEFTHIQVQRNPRFSSVYQLNYYESDYPNKPKLLMILVVDITPTDIDSVRLVYASPKLELIEDGMDKDESDLEFARRFAVLFRHILVYMRTWDYSMNNNHCMVLPYPFFNEENIEIKYPTYLPED